MDYMIEGLPPFNCIPSRLARPPKLLDGKPTGAPLIFIEEDAHHAAILRGHEQIQMSSARTPQRGEALARGCDASVRSDGKPAGLPFIALEECAHYVTGLIGDEQIEVIGIAPHGGHALAGYGDRRISA